MKKLVLFMHISLDGFVTDAEGGMDWIKVDDEIFDDVENFVNQANTALYGRITYQMMDAYWPTAAEQPHATKHDVHHSRWYNNVDKIVISKTLQQNDLAKMTVIGKDIAKEIKQLKQDGDGFILMFGSPTTAHSLMKLDLIDGFWIFVNPILLGAGTPLFKNIKDKQNLALIESKTFACGVIGLRYERS